MYFQIGLEVINFSLVTSLNIIQKSNDTWLVILNGGKDYIIHEKELGTKQEAMEYANRFLSKLNEKDNYQVIE